jgi:signal transduction protein with GAF and PtsI domain
MMAATPSDPAARLARAEALLAERTRQLEAIRAITEEMTRELDLTALLERIHGRAAELVGARVSSVYLWDEAQGVLVPRAWHGVGDWMQDVRLGLGEGLAGAVAARRAGIVVDDYAHSPYASPVFVERLAGC